MRLRIFLAVGAALIAYFALRGGGRPKEAPPAANALASPKVDLLKAHPDLMPEQVAVLLLAPGQEALPAARSLDSAGVPFAVVLDTAAAFLHRVVFIPFGDNPVRMSEALRGDLQAFVTKGGTLVLQAPPENTWSWLTGLESVSPNRKRKRLSFRFRDDPIFTYLTEPEERSILLAGRGSAEGVWSTGLKPLGESGAEAIADFPDSKEAAIVRRPWGAGEVYTIGVDLRDMVVRPQAERHFDAGRAVLNGFEPAADVWALIWRGLYEHATPFWVRLRSVPGFGPFWLMTHDVGPGTDLAQARDFAQMESSRAVAATWFVQTRTGSEEEDAPFFDNKVHSLLAELRRGGDEIASHGVSHGSNFAELPLGGEEKTADYRPATDDDGAAEGATLYGEIRISKLLLEEALSSYTAAGFRAPSLAYPPASDSVLEESGYLYDSSLAANACLTHFPFLMIKGRAMIGESRIVEFPITFSDEVRPGGLTDAAAMLAAARRISAYEGVVVWDVLPSPDPAARGRLYAILAGAPKGTAWLTMGEAARFWSRRQKAQFSFRKGASDSEMILTIQSPSGIGGLSFELSRPMTSCVSDIQTACGGRTVAVDPSVTATEAEITLSLKSAE